LGSNPFEHIRFKPYAEPGVKILDNYYSESDLQPLLKVDSSGLDVTRPGLYLVYYRVTDPSGNTSARVQRLVTVRQFTSVQNQEGQDLPYQIYPNPAKDKVNIIPRADEHIVKIKILNVLGEEVYMLNNITKQNELSISLNENFTKGVYILFMQNDKEEWMSAKFVVE
jgi:hypothetical protein